MAWLAVAVVMSSCGQTGTSGALVVDTAIVPGVRVGAVHLGETQSEVAKALGHGRVARWPASPTSPHPATG